MGDAVLSTHEGRVCTAVAGLLSGGVAMPGGLLVSIHHVLPHYQVWLQVSQYYHRLVTRKIIRYFEVSHSLQFD